MIEKQIEARSNMYNGEEYFETISVTPEEINKKVAEFMKDGFST